MRRLMLLRHAKSSWDHRDLDDASRPLAARGRKAAPMMGRYINRLGIKPDLVLCSPALRTCQTWELVSAEWDQADRSEELRLDVRSSLYLASAVELMSTLRLIGDDVETVMIIGHNPGMGQLAHQLAAEGSHEHLGQMAKKFPTAALAVIKLPIAGWSSLCAGKGELVDFVRPKDLKGAGG